MSKEYDDYKSRAQSRPVGGKGFKLPVGDTTFRVLKTPKGKSSPSVFIEYGMHENVGPEKAYLRCGIDPQTGKGRCYICQKYVPRLRKRGKDSRAAMLEPKIILAIQISVVTKNGKSWTPPIMFSPSKKVSDQLVSSVIGSKKRDYVDPVRGYNLTINRTGTQKNDTRYGMLEADEESSKVPKEVQSKVKPFEELKELRRYDEQRIKTALGLAEDSEDEESDDDDEDEDEAPKNKKGKKKSSRDDEDADEEDESEDDDEDSEEDEDEDDSDDSDDDDDESEDDEDDEDEDEDSDDDDDEDDKPKSKLKKKKKSRR